MSIDNAPVESGIFGFTETCGFTGFAKYIPTPFFGSVDAAGPHGRMSPKRYLEVTG